MLNLNSVYILDLNSFVLIKYAKFSVEPRTSLNFQHDITVYALVERNNIVHLTQ